MRRGPMKKANPFCAGLALVFKKLSLVYGSYGSEVNMGRISKGRSTLLDLDVNGSSGTYETGYWTFALTIQRCAGKRPKKIERLLNMESKEQKGAVVICLHALRRTCKLKYIVGVAGLGLRSLDSGFPHLPITPRASTAFPSRPTRSSRPFTRSMQSRKRAQP
jgi:hypothetical protein